MELTWSNFYDPLVDPLVLAGSSLSLLASTLVLVLFAVYRQEQRTFRHALVFNMTIAEFINTLNATLSGAYFLDTRKLTPGMLCSMNGWIGQVSVQAADFSMLAIAVFTLLTITEKVYMPTVSKTKKVLICLSVWVIPLATGCIAIGMGVMMPAGANWCWISASRTDLRYALTHAWRFAIILAIVCIYGYVYWYTSRHFKGIANTAASPTVHHSPLIGHARQSSIQKSSDDFPGPDTRRVSMPKTTYNTTPKPQPQKTDSTKSTTLLDPYANRDSSWLRLSVCSEGDYPFSPDPVHIKDTVPLLARTTTAPPPYTEGDDYHKEEAPGRPSRQKFGTLTKIETKNLKSPETRRIEREVKRMLLLNAYPILYVLLSIPGLVNRLLQAIGSPPPGRTLDALQTASAFIGFTNAVTYGFNRHLRQRIALDFRNWKARRGTGNVKKTTRS